MYRLVILVPHLAYKALHVEYVHKVPLKNLHIFSDRGQLIVACKSVPRRNNSAAIATSVMHMLTLVMMQAILGYSV